MRLRSFFINNILSSDLFSMRQRVAWLEKLGFDLSYSVCVESGLRIKHPVIEDEPDNNLRLDPFVYINHDCFLDNSASIWIGFRTAIGPRVTILTTTHARGFPHSASGCVVRPVRIGRYCWIGAGVTILPGVRVADNITVGAGAVVINDLTEAGTYVGVPARRVIPRPTPSSQDKPSN